ncbi:hypothetical protein Pint_11218 [Pistacia integerrima]|uniref:Uncharacterized protein n=1 Tax=Pistacia integerrima TaxID=434235 RepID=A0ACC0XIL5_9ROSI|nr:hypothetical protein Pint_11218 [Pistacia integerrima]
MNPIASILHENMLNGKNYVNWTLKLDLVLAYDKIKWVLSVPVPNPPTEESNETTKAYWVSWREADETVRTYMIASMTDVLKKRFQSIPNATEILKTLHKMFGDQGRQARREAIQRFINLSRVSRSSFRSTC